MQAKKHGERVMGEMKWKMRLVFLFLIGLIIIVSGCDGIKGGLDDQTRQVLQNAIDSLNNQPGAWQGTMQNTITTLGDVGTTSAKAVLAEVQSTYTEALGNTGGEAKCDADFIGHRLDNKLKAILHKFDPTAPAPTIVPVVCLTNPTDHVDAGPNPPQTQELVYYGYDFQVFNADQTFYADLVYGDGTIVKHNFGYVYIPHNYELTLTIQGEAQTLTNLDRTKGPAVVLKWGDQKVGKDSGQSALPVLIPTPPPTPTPKPPPKTLTFPTITPVVNTGDVIPYFDIAFQQGDVVSVIAGGCVQTGGHGSTWKRYVNPSGPDSDHLYFGKIYIPGITGGLATGGTPIRDLVGSGSYDSNWPDTLILTFTIPNIDNIPVSDRHLALQYIDDGYGDDGYYAHDDGTEDQCKDVGNAYVAIRIRR